MNFYKHQLQAYKAAKRKDHKGIVFIPTRGGKTPIIMGLCTKSFNYKNNDSEICIVVSPRRALNGQLITDIIKDQVTFLNKKQVDLNKINYTVWHSDNRGSEDFIDLNNRVIINYHFTLDKEKLSQRVSSKKNIIVSTLDSLENLLSALDAKQCLDKVNMLIFDEAHNLITNEHKWVLESNYLKDIKRIRFFTATGKTTDTSISMDNEELFGKVLFKVSPRVLVENEIILPLHLSGLEIDWLKEVKLTTDISDEEWKNILVECVVKHSEWNKAVNNTPYESIIVTGASCFSNNYIVQNHPTALNNYKIFQMASDPDVVGSELSRKNLEDFTKHKGDKILLHYDMVGEGITVKELTCAIALRSINEIKIVQLAGRICGLSDGKVKGQVIIPCMDSLDNSLNTENFKKQIKALREEEYDPFISHYALQESLSRSDEESIKPLDEKNQTDSEFDDELINLIPEEQFFNIEEFKELMYVNPSLYHEKYSTYLKYNDEYCLKQDIKDKKHIDTPVALVKEMLDTLPQDLWSNPDLKFLDPCCGDGTFLWDIVRRLMNGLEGIFPVKEDRMKHILLNQIYGNDINENAIQDIYVFIERSYNIQVDVNIKCIDSLTWKPDMKFDVVVGNPPYNTSIKYTVPKSLDKVASLAAKKRIDAAFVVYSTEKLIKEDGICLMVWPLSWMGLSSWKDFRNWSSNKIETIDVTDPYKAFYTSRSDAADAAAVVAICTLKQNSPSTTLKTYFSEEETNIKICSKPIPMLFNNLSSSIIEKLNLLSKVKLNSKRENSFDVATSSAIPGFSHFFKSRLTSAMFPLRTDKSGKYYISCRSKDESDTYSTWWCEPLPSFIVAMYSADWNASQLNIGQLPDILAILKGRPYSRQLVYDEIGLTKDEVDYLEQKVWELFRIDGVQNRPEARVNDKRKFNDISLVRSKV